MTLSNDWDIMKSTYSDLDFMMFTESTNYPSWNESQQKRYLRGVEKARKMIQTGNFTVNKIQKVETTVKSEPTFNKVKTLRDYLMPHVD